MMYKNLNNVLYWLLQVIEMKLNINQDYIKVGESTQLNVVKEQKITETIGDNYDASNFTWKSTNEDVATVDSTGKVTGIKDGYTTVYAYHEEAKIYAMCVVNVASDFANPQIATGNKFTGIGLGLYFSKKAITSQSVQDLII